MDFSTREIEDANANVFFTQAGYLTFKGIKKLGLKKKYILDYPNIEVKSSFSRLILEANYGLKGLDEAENIIYEKIYDNDIEGLIEGIKKVISAIPYNLHQKEERYYHSLIFAILAIAGLNVRAEEMTNLGRSDVVLEFNERVYIFEAKLDKSAEEALAQIKRRNTMKNTKEKKYIL
nr:PD-(D/E)XK nuclease domain-containing protein [Marinitoga lauensis]